MHLGAIVLGAGAGTRLGGNKALATWRGRSFVSQILSTLQEAGVTRPVVVLGAEAERVIPVLPQDAPYVVNAGWRSGMLGSLLLGLAFLEEMGRLDAVLVWPVDHPAVRLETVKSLVGAFAQGHRPVILPTHGGLRGHPVIFSREVFPALRSAPPDEGARVVVHAVPRWEVPVDDPGVRLDVDTPEGYARLGRLA